MAEVPEAFSDECDGQGTEAIISRGKLILQKNCCTTSQDKFFSLKFPFLTLQLSNRNY
jgi:hypothetical protein